ncbi:uncharacterized protein LOC127872742 isoform X2 [Dreissena polymorpha]|uniref:uncharacterized protein LOC127872742 isoform X2 n=1 Tax=Dreissena polymorpha TaxID=45954 RepID=UPI0022655F22|nr:uncharacterized protein LOC127872742 isoform X2 [Dreissena polymorpha]
MMDYDRKEIQAVEATFPGCFSFLCDFHTEQAWKRWVGPAIGVKDADEVLTMLRSIANSPDEATYNETEGVLKSSSHWLDNKSLQEWFGHFWLNESKRWVTYHRQVLVGKLINTTNGLERQHRHFKEGYLGYYTEGSLTSMVSTLVTKYVPAVCRRYLQQNMEWVSKKYCLPDFLLNKSRTFVNHCLKRVTNEPVASDVKELQENVPSVTSASSGRQYTVDLQVMMPTCSCFDWGKFHWPCKHILHVIMHDPGHGRDTLAESFKNSPLFTVDEGVVEYSSEALPKPPKHEKASYSSSHTKVRLTKPTALRTRCKALASAINNMMFLVKGEGYEDLFFDLSALYKKVRSRVPAEAGLFLRPKKLGRRPSPTYGLKLRKKKRKEIKKTRSDEEDDCPSIQ